MVNEFFFTFEIVIFFISLFYIVFYLFDKIFQIYSNVKRVVKPDKKSREEKIEKIKEAVKNKDTKIDINNKKIEISKEDKEKINKLIKRIDLIIEKGYLEDAKWLIIEWLALDKYNKDLNLLLAKLYEEEKNYTKWEYIYIDLLKAYEDNFEILKKLGFNLAMQKRFNDALKVYEEAYKKRKDSNQIMEVLCDLTFELKQWKKSLKYLKQFLKQFPRNTEKMKMKAYCLEVTWEIDEAIKMYKKVLELQPYNSQVIEKLKHLE